MPDTDELDELPEVEAAEVEAPEVVEPVEPEEVEELADEITITFDGEEPIASVAKPDDNNVVKEMRRQLRKLSAENARLTAQTEAAPLVLTDEVLGPVPTLEACDWDEAKLEAAIEARVERKAQIERNKREREDMAAKQAAADAAEFAEYTKSRAALGAHDFEDAEAAFVDAFPNPAFQRLIVRAAENPGAVIYALYKSPARMAELAAITDAAKMAAAIGRLEARVKVSKTSKVQPEKRVSGTAQLSGTASSSYEANLEKLRAKAEQTGNYTPVLEYKRQWKEKVAR